MKNTFKASMDRNANDITFVISLFLGFLITGFLVFQFGGQIVSVLVSLCLLGAYIDIFLFRPVSYEINDDFLIIHRLVNDVSIPRQCLNKVEIVDTEKLKHAKGTFKVRGLFGYFGKFANQQLGTFTMYATRKNKTVLIETTDHRKVILTPDRPAKFVRQLQN
jgi:hypothetical protein